MIIDIKPNHDLNKVFDANDTYEAGNYDIDELKFPDSIYEEMPEPLNGIFQIISDPQKKDIALLSILTILSNVIKKLKVIYHDSEEGCQLFCYVVGNPASSKGYAAKYKQIGAKLHKWLQNRSLRKIEALERSKEEVKKASVETFYLPGNISKAALTQQLSANKGYGVFFETEADTIANANRSDYGSFTEILRKGFHGEDYAVDKLYMDNKIEIEKVCLSVFLTSTFNQCLKLMPSFEDGLISRFMFYILSPNSVFETPFDTKNYSTISKEIDSLGKLVFAMGVRQQSLDRCLFEFTHAQQREIEAVFLSFDQKVSISNPYIKASGYRLALITTRIAMIFTYLKYWNRIKDNTPEKIICPALEFERSVTIAKSLMSHLMRIESMYAKNSKKFNQQAFIKNERPKNYENIKQALALYAQGLSTRQIAAKVLGNDKLNGTISKWVKKYKDAPFPVLEPETPLKFDTEAMLRKQRVSVFNPRNNEDENKSLLFICKSEDNSGIIRNLDYYAPVEKRRQVMKQIMQFIVEGQIDDGNNIISNSGFIAVEVLAEQNKSVTNFSSLKDKLRNIINVAYCGKTLANDYLLLIPISEPDSYQKHHTALKMAFQKLGINIGDYVPNKKIAICYDSNAYLSKQTTVFTQLA